MAIDIATARTEIAKLYIAAFNRVPDSDGLSFWVDSYVNHGVTLNQIAQYFTDSTEYQSTYPAYQTTADYVEAIYVNVFGRGSDAAGKAYWIARLETASTAADHLTHGTLMQAMVDAAMSNGSTDGQKLTNQATFAINSVIAGIDNASATAQLANVTADAASITTATTAATTASDNAAGQSFTLTDGVNTFTGGNGNDTFIADNSTATVVTSLADVLNGGAGTDTLTVYGFDNTTDAVPQISNIENIVLANSVAGSNISLANATGVTSVVVKDAVGASTTTVADGVTVTLQSNDNSGTVQTVNYSATQTSANLVLNAAAGTTGIDTAVTGAAVTTLNIATTGAASSIGNLNVDALMATVVITGDKNLTIVDAVEDAVDTINASAFTGDLSVKFAAPTDAGTVSGMDAADITINTGSGNDTVDATNFATGKEMAINTGAGNDKVVIVKTATASMTAATSTNAGVVINGGTGTDTLSVNGDITEDLSGIVSGMEVLEFTADAAGTAMTTNKLGINSFVMTNATTDIVLTGLSNNASIKVKDAASGAATDGDITATIATDTTSDAISVEMESTSGSTITLNNYDTLNLSSTKAATDASTVSSTADGIAATTVSTLNISGTQALTITTAALKAAATVTSTSTGNVTSTFTTQLGSYTGGAGNDVLSLAAGNLAQGKTFAGGAGTDSITVAASASQDMGILAMTGFETVNFTTSGANAMDMRNVTDLTTFKIAAATAGTDTLTLTRMNSATTLEIAAATTGIVTTIASGTSQDVKVSANVTSTALTLDSGTTTLNLTFDDGDATTAETMGTITTLTGTSLATINVLGKDDANLGTIDAASVTTINASASTGNLTVTASTTATSITGSQVADSITGNTALDTIRGGKGDDTINAGTGDTKADVIIFEANGADNGNDTLTIEAGYDKLNFTNFISSIAVDQNGGTGTAIVAYGTASASDVNITNKVALYADATLNGGSTSTTVAALIEGAGDAFSLTAGGKAIIITGDATGANDVAQLWYIDDSLDGVSGTISATDVVQVGVTGAPFDLDTLTTANFMIA